MGKNKPKNFDFRGNGRHGGGGGWPPSSVTGDL